MYYEQRVVRIDGTFKNILLAAGAVVAPFALLLLPAREIKAGDVVAWVIILALMGALVGVIVGYAIDELVMRARARRI